MATFSRGYALVLSLLVCSQLVYSVPDKTPISTSAISLANCCNSAQDATVFALIVGGTGENLCNCVLCDAYATVQYGYPLMSYVNFTSFLLTAIGGPNRIVTQQQLASTTTRNVVKPNVDTLYSIVYIDLSVDDLVLTVPEINDGRYWVFPFYDP